MNTHTRRNSILAAIGLAALLVYILACTSFSPDDSKVAYPAFDDKSGAVCVSVYDRKTGASEQVFTAATIKNVQSTNNEPCLLRPQWLPDGRHILVAFPEEKSLTLALLPFGVREPVRLFSFPEIKEAAPVLMMPLPIIGSRVFFCAAEKSVARLDLITGEVRTHEFANEVNFCSSADNGTLLVMEEVKGNETETVLSRMNPDTFALQPLMRWTNQVADGGFLAFNHNGSKVAFAEERGDGLAVTVVSGGKVEASRPIGLKDEKVGFGLVAAFSPKEDRVFATFRRAPEAGTNAGYGVVEFPLNGAPPRWTTLLTASRKGNEGAVVVFQPAFSHDGRTLAVASTYLLLQDETVKPDDCALLLVDLSDPQRKVTKVKITPPRERQRLISK